MKKKLPKCRVCNSRGKSQSLRAPTVFGDSDRNKAFYQCANCNLIYMWPPLDELEESEFYAKEFEKFMEVRSGPEFDWSGPEQHIATNAGNVTRRWNVMQKYCESKSKLLEIGCSSGFMLDKFSSEGMSVVGIEPSGGFSDYLKKKKYEIYKDIDDLSQKYANYFDVICHFFVLEHISDTRKFIKQQLELLRPEGLIFCEVPSATDPLTSHFNIPKFEEFYWSIAHHYYFTPDSINYLMADLEITNYEIIPEQRYDISNHVTWLQDGVPGGQNRYPEIFTNEMNEIYKNNLISNGFFDTFFLVIKK